jgi:hypothetical protein
MAAALLWRNPYYCRREPRAQQEEHEHGRAAFAFVAARATAGPVERHGTSAASGGRVDVIDGSARPAAVGADVSTEHARPLILHAVAQEWGL